MTASYLGTILEKGLRSAWLQSNPGRVHLWCFLQLGDPPQHLGSCRQGFGGHVQGPFNQYAPYKQKGAKWGKAQLSQQGRPQEVEPPPSSKQGLTSSRSAYKCTKVQSVRAPHIKTIQPTSNWLSVGTISECTISAPGHSGRAAAILCNQLGDNLQRSLDYGSRKRFQNTTATTTPPTSGSSHGRAGQTPGKESYCTDRGTPSVSFFSPIFTIPKKIEEHQLLLNLKALNKFIPKQHFKMEGGHLLGDLLLQGNWMT